MDMSAPAAAAWTASLHLQMMRNKSVEFVHDQRTATAER